MSLFASFLFYAAAATLLAGIITMFRRPSLGAAVAGAALALIVILLFWPPRTKRAGVITTQLDRAMPVWQFDERHTLHVAAPPEKVFASIHAVTADEILLFQTLTAIRRGFRRAPESIINAPKNQPLIDIATRNGFRYLADDAREIVVITRITPGVNATMNFLITPEASGTNLSTETRVYADSKRGERAFTIYWRMIQPGSDIIRRMWLRAVKIRAEA